MDAMLLVVRNGMHDEVGSLLAQNTRLLHSRTGDGLTLLMEAARHGRTAIVNLLVRNGAPIGDVHHIGDGVTALYYAVRAGHADVVAQLVHHGARLVIQGAPRFSALMLACQVKQVKVVQTILMQSICNTEYINSRDEYGRTALCVACEGGSLPIIRALLLGGADVAVTDEHGVGLIESARNAFQHATVRVLEWWIMWSENHAYTLHRALVLSDALTCARHTSAYTSVCPPPVGSTLAPPSATGCTSIPASCSQEAVGSVDNGVLRQMLDARMGLAGMPVLELVGFEADEGQESMQALAEKAGAEAELGVDIRDVGVWEWSDGAEEEDEEEEEALDGEGAHGKGEDGTQGTWGGEQERAAMVAYVLHALPGELVTELMAGITV